MSLDVLASYIPIGRIFLACVARYSGSSMHRIHLTRVGQAFLSGRTFHPWNNCPVGQNILGNMFPGHLFLRTDFSTTPVTYW